MSAYEPVVIVDKGVGWARVDGDRIPELDAATYRCRALFVEAQDLPAARWQDGRNKAAFLRTILADTQICAEPALLALALAPSLLATACTYFGAVPRLTAARLWWTPSNDSAKSSQLWHRDTEAPEILKLFLNVTDVDPDCGPLTFCPRRCLGSDRDPATRQAIHLR